MPEFASAFWAERTYKANKNEKLLPPKTAGEENEVADAEDENVGAKVKFGIFLEPEQHMEQALFLSHPMDVATILPDALKRAVFKMMTVEPHVLAQQRLDMLKLYKSRALELQEEEAKLHNSLPRHVQQVVSGKRLRLLEERLNATGFPDLQVLQDFQTGVNLVGEEPFSPLYMEKLQPASMTIQQLEASAPYN